MQRDPMCQAGAIWFEQSLDFPEDSPERCAVREWRWGRNVNAASTPPYCLFFRSSHSPAGGGSCRYGRRQLARLASWLQAKEGLYASYVSREACLA